MRTTKTESVVRGLFWLPVNGCLAHGASAVINELQRHNSQPRRTTYRWTRCHCHTA